MSSNKSKFKKEFVGSMLRCGRSSNVTLVVDKTLDGVCSMSKANPNVIYINTRKLNKLNTREVKMIARHEAFHYIFSTS